MQGEIYYQWQNEFLRRTIYPLREMKLRDFLVAFFEIDLWAKYKTLRLEKLQQEVQEHQQTQARLRREYYGKYLEHKKYFLLMEIEPAFKSRFPQPDPDVLAYFTQMHKTFARYFPNYENTAKEMIFLSSRISEVERERKRYQDELVRVRRNLINMGETWKHWQRDSDRKALLEEVILPMIDQEYLRLLDFSQAMAKVESRRKQMLSWVKEKRKTRDTLLTQLNAAAQALPIHEKRFRDRPTPELEKKIAQTKAEIAALTAQQAALAPELERDEIELVEKITITPEVTKEDLVRGKIEAYRSELNLKTHDELLELVVRRFLDDPARYPLWLQYMVIHFSGMRYQSAHGSWADPREMLTALTEKAIEGEIQQADDLSIEAFCQEKILIYDTAPAKADEGSRLPALALTSKPRWKASAADNLRRLKQYNLRLKAKAVPAQAAVPLYEEKTSKMQASAQTLRKGTEVVVDPLPIHQEQDYYRITQCPSDPRLVNLCLASQDAAVVPNAYKRKALLDLRLAEEAYRIEEELDDQEVLSELSLMRSKLDLPSWMWHEIVKLTDLRLQTDDANWENKNLTPEEQEQLYSFKYRAYSAILNKWKQANLTGWREEHDRSHRLIVTRAVCNEVAEHIQHLRGLTPPGGLTAKPNWYRRREKDPTLGSSTDRPFFVKARKESDFKPGASLLWLRFVPKEPNAWQVAHPTVLGSGEGLFPNGFPVGSGSAEPQGVRYDPSKVPVIRRTSPWNFFQIPDGRYKRSRSVTDPNEKSFRDDQWLRWMHEATIVGLFEMVDGPTVLTFETALPDEDRRRATIGIFRHALHNLIYTVTPAQFTGTFIGYTPEDSLPLDSLQEQLDWNKVLLKKGFLSPREKSAFWSSAAGVDLQPSFSPSFPSIGPARTPAGPTQVETAPPLRQKKEEHKETVRLYEVDPLKRQASVYCPELEILCIELRRGLRLEVDRSKAVAVGQESYLKVLACEEEPLAVDLYVQAATVIDAPAEKPDLFGLLPAQAPAYTLSHLDAAGLPVFIPFKGKDGREAALDANTRLLFSGAHCLTAKDSGGPVQGADQQKYYLILECPTRPGLAGLFVRAGQVKLISQAEYIGSSTSRQPAAQKLPVLITPQGGKGTVAFFQKSGETFSQVETLRLPSSTQLNVSPILEFTRTGEFQQILDFPTNPRLVGRYLRSEDISPVVKVTF